MPTALLFIITVFVDASTSNVTLDPCLNTKVSVLEVAAFVPLVTNAPAFVLNSNVL